MDGQGDHVVIQGVPHFEFPLKHRREYMRRSSAFIGDTSVDMMSVRDVDGRMSAGALVQVRPIAPRTSHREAARCTATALSFLHLHSMA